MTTQNDDGASLNATMNTAGMATANTGRLAVARTGVATSAAACVVPVLLALLPLSSGAAESSAEQVKPLEMVIVTARRMEQTANDVGLDVQAYTGEKLERLRIDSVSDLTALVPSFTVAQSYQGVPTYTLRGIGFNTVNMSATSTVGTYIDEVAYPYPIMNSGPVFDMQRVEVLKGPQGTLFGRNTTAGLINLVTNKPADAFEGMARMELGNFETTNFEGMVSGPLTDQLSGRLALRTEDSGEGWQKSNSSSDTQGEVHKYGLRAALAFAPTPQLAIDVSYNGWLNQSDTLASQATGLSASTADSAFNAPGLLDYIEQNAPRNNNEADWAPRAQRSADIGTGLGLGGDLAEDSELHALKLAINYEFDNGMRLNALTGYQDLERKALVDFGGAPYELLVQDLDGSIESLSQELRLEGEWNDTQWLLGAYYAKDDILDSNRTLLGQNANVGLIRAFTVPLLDSPFNAGGYTIEEATQAFRTFRDEAHMDVESWSVFASATQELMEDLSLTAGLRYTEDSQDYGGCSRDFNGNMLPNVNVTNRALFLAEYGALVDEIEQGECNTFDPETITYGLVESQTNEDNIAWRLELDWFVDPDTLLYGSVSQGAKAGNTPVNAANISTQNAPVGQEELLAYELGVKATLLQQRMQWNASVFYYDYDDKQLAVFFRDPIFTILARLANVPKSEAYGLDTELTWGITEHFTAIAAATLLHTEIQDYIGIDSLGQPADYDGAKFLYSPEVSGTLTLLYNRPLTQSLGLSINLNGRYQTDSAGDLEDSAEARVDAFGVLNGGIGIYALDASWDINLWGSNLTDEYYWLAVTQNANTWVRLPGKARTYGATLTYRF